MVALTKKLTKTAGCLIGFKSYRRGISNVESREINNRT